MKPKRDLCDLCGGEMAPGKTSLEIRHNGELVILKDIEATICGQCGESWLTADVSEKLDGFLAEYRLHRPMRYIPVPEFSASQMMR